MHYVNYDSSILSAFSALQRAENSSICAGHENLVRRVRLSVLFSEPKIPQCLARSLMLWSCWPFSALQRAENSSIVSAFGAVERDKDFQCSSASRKFLNSRCRATRTRRARLSVLFSEPKIPQYELTAPVVARLVRTFSALQRAENSSIRSRRRWAGRAALLSVLFSEPKIPQCEGIAVDKRLPVDFQCSSASRKFLNSIHL